MSTLYGSILVALGAWAAYTTARTVSASRGLRRHRTLVLVGACFVASCLLPGVALLALAFAPWMLVPLGACFLALLPMPCYFSWANDGWIRAGRNVLFSAVGAALLAAGIGVLPLRWLGL